MATVGIAEAARMAGVAQSTIHRAMQAGRLSYTIDPVGKRRVDVAELERVFEIKSAESVPLAGGNGALSENGARTVHRKAAHRAEIEVLQQVLDERERTVALQSEVIRDLRRRLDDSEVERQRLSERLAGLLERRAAGSVPTVVPAPTVARGWWRRLFG